MREFGLAAVLTFVDRNASENMRRVSRVATDLRGSLRTIGAGAERVGKGLGTIAMASAPVGAAFAWMARDGIKFEAAMANLRAVSLDVGGETTAELRALAKTMGLTTKFSATEAADAMTELSRAGFETKEVMAAIPGTLAAAAAEGMSLADAASITANNVRAFKLSAKDAGEIAGVLALASARTNASIGSLQEGLKFAAPVAQNLNYSFKDTVLTLGALHDIGIKGTLSGTALRRSLQLLTNPTKKVSGALRELGISGSALKDEHGQMKSLPTVYLNIADKLRGIPDLQKRASIAARVFGITAQSLGSAFNLTGEDMDRFRRVQSELTAETGDTAKAMAALQMTSFSGQWKFLRSTLEVINIELFDMISGFTKGGVQRAVDVLTNLYTALRHVRGERLTDPTSVKLLKSMPPIYLEIARGIRDGFSWAKETIKSVATYLGDLGKKFAVLAGDGGARSVARLVTQVALGMVALGPAALAFYGVTKLIGGAWLVISGGGQVLLGLAGAARVLGAALLGPVGIAGALAFALIDFKDVFLGAWGEIRASGILTGLKDSFGGLVDSIGGLLAAMLGVHGSAEGWRTFGKVVGDVLIFIGSVLKTVVDSLTEFIRLVTMIPTAGSKLDQDIKSGDAWNSVKNMFGGGTTYTPALPSADQQLRGAAGSLLGNLADLYGSGKRTVTENGATKVLTRGFAEGKVVAYLGKLGATQEQVRVILANLNATLAKFGPATGQTVTGTPPKDAIITGGGLMPVGAGDVLLDRAALAQAITTQTPGGLIPRATDGRLGGAQGAGSGTIRIEIPVQIDGRAVARAVAEVKLDRLDRAGDRLPAGTRRDYSTYGD